MPNLELAVMGIGYQFGDNDGFRALTLGARYQFMPMLIAAADIALPLNSEDVVGTYDPFGIFAAIQYTQNFMPELALGSELGFSWLFEDEDFEQGLLMKLQAELDYTIASIGLTPWVGFEFDYQLTDSEAAGYDVDDSGNNEFSFWIGAVTPSTRCSPSRRTSSLPAAISGIPRRSTPLSTSISKRGNSAFGQKASFRDGPFFYIGN